MVFFLNQILMGLLIFELFSSSMIRGEKPLNYSKINGEWSLKRIEIIFSSTLKN